MPIISDQSQISLTAGKEHQEHYQFLKIDCSPLIALDFTGPLVSTSRCPLTAARRVSSGALKIHFRCSGYIPYLNYASHMNKQRPILLGRNSVLLAIIRNMTVQHPSVFSSRQHTVSSAGTCKILYKRNMATKKHEGYNKVLQCIKTLQMYKKLMAKGCENWP